MTWTRIAKTPFAPAEQVWVCHRGLLLRMRRPTIAGQPTGGWWVLYDRQFRVIRTREFRRDQSRIPPTTWANRWLTFKT